MDTIMDTGQRTVEVLRPEGMPSASDQSGSTQRKKRIFCYMRVSTDRQETSLDSQMAGFNQKIAETPSWELAGVYADEGLSGTSARKRKEFNRMIADAKAGGCDIILCKSLSRFARNTVITLKTTRELKEYGVSCIFEKENI